MLKALTDPTYGRRNRITAAVLGLVLVAGFVLAWNAFGLGNALFAASVVLAIVLGASLATATAVVFMPRTGTWGQLIHWDLQDRAREAESFEQARRTFRHRAKR